VFETLRPMKLAASYIQKQETKETTEMWQVTPTVVSPALPLRRIERARAEIAPEAMPPRQHLFWGQALVEDLQPKNNLYGCNPSEIRWAGVDGAAESYNHTRCASFVNLLLQRAYGYTAEDFQIWMGSASPNAVRYHASIAAKRGFRRIQRMGEVLPGDILAIQYGINGSRGHVAIVAEAPIFNGVVNGMLNYDVPILDSTDTPHGPLDTRLRLREGVDAPVAGAGRGLMRIYASTRDETILAYRWSAYAPSMLCPQSDSWHLVVGRLAGERAAH
jgi:hypothetical protein